MIFLSCSSDHPYYHWQTEVMILNFMAAGINPNHIEVVFCYQHQVSPGGRALANAYPFVRVFFYENIMGGDGGYGSLCRPHALAKHFDAYPNLAKETLFYHDCDILFRGLPDFARLSADSICYLSDTVSYIGASYIQSKGSGILERMAEIVGLDPRTVIANERSSGGAQYLLKGIDAAFWRKVERDCRALFAYFVAREAEERKTLSAAQLLTYNPIQKWCADMWAVLWNLWASRLETRIAPELSFSWATSAASEWDRHAIYHNAGITEALRATHFYKGDYIHREPWDADLSHVRPDFCSWRYAQAIARAKEERKQYRSRVAQIG